MTGPGDERRPGAPDGYEKPGTDPGGGGADRERTAEADRGGAGGDDRDELAALRERIIDLDEELVRLVGERRALVLAIGELKARLGMQVMDPAREARVVRRAASLAREEGVDEELVRDVIWRIVASARDAQEDRSRWGPPESQPPADEVE